MRIVSTIIATTIVLLSGAALADIRVADTHNGAWVTVTHDGSPIERAQVSVKNVPQQKKTYITNERGRVFVPLTLENSRSIKYIVKKPNSKSYESRFAFHATNK